jgi:uncharacterized LabA/DUF88 family protein
LEKRTVWIIDGAYLMRSAPGRFDYLKLRGELESRWRIDEAYYLNSIQDPPTEQMLSFHTWLKSAPPKGPKIRVQLYRVKELDCLCPSCHNRFERTVQKGVDVGVATLILKLAHQQRYDRLILCAGDGDFEDAIEYVKSELHKELYLVGFQDTISADLQSYADSVIWLNELWDKIRRD